ncbi:MAG: CHASE3 domain-containing protein, partial [Terracidiphilus sp.]
MQTFFKRFSVIAGFAVLLAVLVANAFVTRRELSIQDGDAARVAHSRQVLYELSQAELLLTKAETGQRGFLYTGDPKYLAPYNAAISQVHPHIDSLAQLTADNPREQVLVDELKIVSGTKLAELARTISLFQAGQKDAVRQLVLSDVGLVHMDEIRHVVSQMQQEETKAEAERARQYERSIRQTVASIYLASFLATLGLVLLAYFILREMDLREKHAQEIRSREEWFRVTLTSIGDAVIATDRRGRVTFLNPVAEKLIGTRLANAVGKEINEVFPIFNEVTRKPVEDPVRKVLELGHVVGLANHTVLQNSDGSLVPIEDSAAPIRDDQSRLLGVVLVFRDVTNERKAQEVMRKTEKLAAAARLSATVAHEINNPLEAVVNLVYIAKQSAENLPAVVQTLNLAEQELDRVAHLTRQTLGFYRESNVPERIEVPDLIETVLKLYSNRLKNKSIRVVREFGECPPVYGVCGELKQVVSNLIANAADAVSANGTIVVKSQCVVDKDSTVVQVVIEDDGPGIPSENVDRIFEPFFTTKEDVGTGLGLWITKEIVSRHGGSILVRCRDGDSAPRGAAFTVTLPLNGELQPGTPDELS